MQSLPEIIYFKNTPATAPPPPPEIEWWPPNESVEWAWTGRLVSNVLSGRGPTLNQPWFNASPISTIHSTVTPDAGSMLVQRRRRWTNIEPALGQCIVLNIGSCFLGVWSDGQVAGQQPQWSCASWGESVYSGLARDTVLFLCVYSRTAASLPELWQIGRHTARNHCCPSLLKLHNSLPTRTLFYPHG